MNLSRGNIIYAAFFCKLGITRRCCLNSKCDIKLKSLELVNVTKETMETYGTKVYGRHTFL